MHHVAFKIGLLVTFVAGAMGWLFAELAATPAGYALVTALVCGAVAYGAAVRLLAGRIEHVASILDEMVEEGSRNERVVSAKGDDLDRLVRRSDQALHAVRKRVAELNRADSFRREYVGDVSHEIKTPIFAIQGFAETLLNGALSDPSVNRGFVEKIFSHASRLNALAKDLSEISRLETGALKLSMAPFGARPMLHEVVESLEEAARRKGIDVRINVDDEAGVVEGDRERICQVLTNLLDNAIKYTNEGGWVEVRADRGPPGQVRFSVEDAGIGIESEDVHRITERFYRVAKSRSRDEGGTGLGLSIVKHILAAHGTALRIESRVGEGSTFSFTLPAGRPAAGSA